MNIEHLLSFLLEEKTRVPKTGYHVTLLKGLPKILKQGLLLPDKSKRQRTWAAENRIYLFVDPNKTQYIANDIGLSEEEDWVLLKVGNLNPKFLMPDDDWGDTWQESIKYGGTFAYGNSIPPSSIKVIAKAIGTEEEYHDRFVGLVE